MVDLRRYFPVGGLWISGWQLWSKRELYSGNHFALLCCLSHESAWRRNSPIEFWVHCV